MGEKSRILSFDVDKLNFPSSDPSSRLCPPATSVFFQRSKSPLPSTMQNFLYHLIPHIITRNRAKFVNNLARRMLLLPALELSNTPCTTIALANRIQDGSGHGTPDHKQAHERESRKTFHLLITSQEHCPTCHNALCKRWNPAKAIAIIREWWTWMYERPPILQRKLFAFYAFYAPLRDRGRAARH